MIVRNEERNLAACLKPLQQLFDEIIVLDTGSTDRTREIAREHGATVYEEPWRDDFAFARNASVERATGDWVFWLDADDRLNAENVQRLRSLFARLGDEQVAYMMSCVCTPEHASDIATTISHVRLYRRDPRVHWRRRIHEQLVFDAVPGHEIRWTDVEIEHVGYRDPVLGRRKLNRDIRLLKLDYALNPDETDTLFYLGSAYVTAGEYGQALVYLKLCLDRAEYRSPMTRKLFGLLTESLSKLGRKQDAIAMACQGLANFPDDPELLYREATLHGEIGELPQAEACLLRLISTPADRYIQLGVETGLNNHKARQLLAILYCDQGRYRESERTLQELLAERPADAHAWVALGQLYLTQKKLRDVDYVSRQLDKCPDGEVYAAVLRAEGHMARNELVLARTLLDQAIALAPRLLWARLVLSDLLLREANDLRACVAAQQNILEIDPGNTMARHNLAALTRIAQQPAALAQLCTSEIVGV
jgi:glycosyltransferase involved in cell wall biosynthesis